MELNKSSITSLIIAACAGLVLGAGATYYYYARAGGDLDNKIKGNWDLPIPDYIQDYWNNKWTY